MPAGHDNREKLLQDLLALVRRYELMIPEAAANYFEISAQRAKSLLNRLSHEKRLRRISLYRNRLCYVIESKDKRGTGLGENNKIRRYATLMFCLMQGRRRHKLTSAEFIKKFGLTRRAERYFIDNQADHPLMGYLRVDLAGVGRWDRIVFKALGDARYHLGRPEFQPFIVQNAFEIRIITPLSQKAEQIRRRLSTSETHHVRIRVTSIPELINLISPLPSNRITRP